ncbi:MAG: hypothetical protein HDP28_04010 [Clostridia bacterium]|nr:hypothetical protein [Clostridia bacterium]
MAKNKLGENRMNDTKARRFWRIQGECWRRMITPYIMYLFTSMLLLATQAIENVDWLRYFLGTLCILLGASSNAYLAYKTGISHYDVFLTGCIHRRNREQGIMSGGDHHPEREYAPWKGFYIGFLIGIPVIVFAGLSCIPGAFINGFGRFFLIMFAGFAIVPVSWIFGGFSAGVSSGMYACSMLFVLLPVIVTGVFYIIGAHVEKKRKKVIEERMSAVREATNEKEESHGQTEEEKRETLQPEEKKK